MPNKTKVERKNTAGKKIESMKVKKGRQHRISPAVAAPIDTDLNITEEDLDIYDSTDIADIDNEEENKDGEDGENQFVLEEGDSDELETNGDGEHYAIFKAK